MASGSAPGARTRDRQVSERAILVLGGAGMLGRAVGEVAAARRVPCLVRGRRQLDLCDTAQIGELLRTTPIGAVVNCAAFTDVDGCEDRREHAMEVNGYAVGRLARVAAEHRVAVVHVSTDYVFAGDAEQPYREDDAPAPRSVYGESKLLGERLALGSGNAVVVRTSWLFGPGGRNFVRTIVESARAGRPLRVVDDQVGCPTYTPHLAEALVTVARSVLERTEPAPPSVLHYRDAEAVSWYELARASLESWEIDAPVVPVGSEEYPRPAPRPAYSVLAVDRWEAWSGGPVARWRDGLRQYRAHAEGAALVGA